MQITSNLMEHFWLCSVPLWDCWLRQSFGERGVEVTLTAGLGPWFGCWGKEPL